MHTHVEKKSQFFREYFSSFFSPLPMPIDECPQAHSHTLAHAFILFFWFTPRHHHTRQHAAHACTLSTTKIIVSFVISFPSHPHRCRMFTHAHHVMSACMCTGIFVFHLHHRTHAKVFRSFSLSFRSFSVCRPLAGFFSPEFAAASPTHRHNLFMCIFSYYRHHHNRTLL